MAMLVIIGGGWMLLTKTAQYGNKRDTESRSIRSGVIEVVDKQTEEKVKSTTVMGKVTDWDNSKGVLTLDIDGGEKQFILNPDNMTIYIPTKGNKTNQVLMVNSSEGLRWQTAFCEGDRVTVATGANGRITLVDNGGYRQCGFIEE